MPTFLELHIKGGGCAIIDTGVIAGAMRKGSDLFAAGTPESPTLVIIRGGETLEVVGESPGVVIARMVNVRMRLAEQQFEAKRLGGVGPSVLVDYLTEMGAKDDAAGDRNGG